MARREEDEGDEVLTGVHGLGSVAVIDDLLYAIGGWDGHLFLSSGERYDPAANAWSPIASMATERVCTAAVAL